MNRDDWYFLAFAKHCTPCEHQLNFAKSHLFYLGYYAIKCTIDQYLPEGDVVQATISAKAMVDGM